MNIKFDENINYDLFVIGCCRSSSTRQGGERGAERNEKASRMNDTKVRFDVVIVGYGPVGAALANLLGNYGVKTLVVDRDDDIFMSPRAIALDNEALRVLQMAGIGEDAFERIAIPMVHLYSPLFGEFGRISSGGSLDGHPKLVTFYQPELERALRDRLAQAECVETWTGTTLVNFEQSDDAVRVDFVKGDGENTSVVARYLVGADGASSFVRKQIGQDFKGTTYAQDWLIVDARHTAEPIDRAEFICDPRRPGPHMIAPGGRERWEFMLLPGEDPAEMESDTKVRELLRPWTDGEEPEIERKAVYRFHARTVECFQRGRVFLAGDAAHITPPFAGQGLVAGLRDAANLGWKLAWVIKGRSPESILASYDTERRPHAVAIIRLAQFLGRLIMPRNIVVAAIVHGSLRTLRTLPFVRRWFDELGMKPKNEFKHGLFVRGASRARLVRGGVLPQGWVRAPDQPIRLSDDVLGPALCLIGFGRDPRGWLDDHTAAAFADAGGRCIQIRHRGQTLHRSADLPLWEDLDATLMPTAAPFGWCAVVRPDRTIMHDGPVEEAARIVREALSLLAASTHATPANTAA